MTGAVKEMVAAGMEKSSEKNSASEFGVGSFTSENSLRNRGAYRRRRVSLEGGCGGSDFDSPGRSG